MISNCSHDENGKYHGGKAGDQTGSEWVLRSWYNRPWTVILRHPDASIREMIAEMATKAANNDHIGYDQDGRYTFWEELRTVNYDPEKIYRNCEADCSSGVTAIVKGIGQLIGDNRLKGISLYTYTGDMKKNFVAGGFIALNDSKYLTSEDYLLRGDILLYEGHHVATNLTTGRKAISTDSRPTIYKGYKDSKKGGSYCAEMQTDLKALGYKGKLGRTLAIDGSAGGNTIYALENFQKEHKDVDTGKALAVDGRCGPASWKALLAAVAGLQKSYRVKLITELNLRKGPGTKYAAISVVPASAVYNVSEEQNGWVYLNEAGGWVSAKYVRKI